MLRPYDVHACVSGDYMPVEHEAALKHPDKTTVDAGCQPLSLVTFLLCVIAAVGIGMMLLHMLSQLGFP